jgi:hypothetical protein
MRITEDANESARLGTPAYRVSEEDRSVCWIYTLGDLEALADWDRLPIEARRERIANWLHGGGDIPTNLVRMDSPIRAMADLSGLEQHALVARNSLRSYLGVELDKAPADAHLVRAITPVP